jgi:hypothetical protein
VLFPVDTHMNSKVAEPTYTALGFIGEVLRTLTVVFPFCETLTHASCPLVML